MMKRVFIYIIIVAFFSILILGLNYTDGKKYSNSKEVIIREILLDNLVGMSIDEVEKYAKDVDIKLDISYEYSYDFSKDTVILQDKEVNSKISNGDVVKIVISKGEVPISILKENNVNEL